jgi:hypothetical protein
MVFRGPVTNLLFSFKIVLDFEISKGHRTTPALAPTMPTFFYDLDSDISAFDLMSFLFSFYFYLFWWSY